MKHANNRQNFRPFLFLPVVLAALLPLITLATLSHLPAEAARAGTGRHNRHGVTLQSRHAGLHPATGASTSAPPGGGEAMNARPEGMPASQRRLLQTRCSPPVNYDARDGQDGLNIALDQCYEQSFTVGGNTYWVLAYYTENTAQDNITATHSLPNVDNTNGDNVYAVQAVTETIRAWKFYMNKGFIVPSDGSDQIDIYIAEDNRAGGTPGMSHIVDYDDEIVESNDNIQKTVAAHHEVFHLVQFSYDDSGGWQDWWGEGTARAMEDRVDSTVDADAGHWFIPQLNSYLSNKYRQDFTTISYDSALWWNYMMDQHTRTSESEPSLGVESMRRYLVQMDTDDDALTGLLNHLVNEGSSFDSDWIDFTLANYAKDYNPTDARLKYIDTEVMSNTNPLNIVTSTVRPYAVDNNHSMQARSAEYWEIRPASNCDYVSFTFDGNGQAYGFSVMTVEGGNLKDRWTSKSTSFARTVRSKSLDRVVGVVSALSNAGTVDIGYGCVSPQINIKRPTQTAYAIVGLPSNPRQFIVRLEVFSDQATTIAGLTKDDFVVKVGGITSTIASAAYVQDDYWLLVQAPGASAGMQAGQFYSVTVQLDTATDTELNAVLYVDRTQDTILVLDKSGSMSDFNKIQAARNAADLLVSELSDDDQGGLVRFDTDAAVAFHLAQMGTGSNRQDLRNAISSTVAGDRTSIGDGMSLGAQERHDYGKPENVCGIILLSDGHENEPLFWSDVVTDVLNTGCALHTIAFGPEANEVLLQQIAASAPGGSYDYADVGGGVPVALQATLNAENVSI
ncbi:MAG: VWA domain-containing protein, partial [Chloroflexi bacterium]